MLFRFVFVILVLGAGPSSLGIIVLQLWPSLLLSLLTNDVPFSIPRYQTLHLCIYSTGLRVY